MEKQQDTTPLKVRSFRWEELDNLEKRNELKRMLNI